MTPRALARAERELEPRQRKVFACVPVREPWNHTRINSELRRQGIQIDRDVMRGILSTLKTIGIIREPIHDHFQRIEIAILDTQYLKDEPTMATMPTAKPEKTTTTHRATSVAPTPANDGPGRKLTTLDRLARISLKFRELADELDDIAIQADEDMKAQGQDSETLRQLQKLLGNIGARA